MKKYIIPASFLIVGITTSLVGANNLDTIHPHEHHSEHISESITDEKRHGRHNGEDCCDGKKHGMKNRDGRHKDGHHKKGKHGSHHDKKGMHSRGFHGRHKDVMSNLPTEVQQQVSDIHRQVRDESRAIKDEYREERSIDRDTMHDLKDDLKEAELNNQDTSAITQEILTLKSKRHSQRLAMEEKLLAVEKEAANNLEMIIATTH